MGSPPAVKPQGTEIPGIPARLVEIVKMSERYICIGSSVFSPILKAGVGVVGVRMHVAVRERLVEIPLDQRPDLGGLLVVGVVVARREGVGPDHDPPLHLGAEARGAGLLVHLQQIAALSGAEAVLDAVVAGEVGARLRRGDDVVDGQTVLGVGKRDLDALRPRPPRRPGSPRRTAASTSGSIPAIKYSFGIPTVQPSIPWPRNRR